MLTKKWVGLSPKRISWFFLGPLDFTDFTSDFRLVALVAREIHPTLDTMHDCMVGSLWNDRRQNIWGPKFPGLGARILKDIFVDTQLVFCMKHSFFRFRTFRFSWASSTRTVAQSNELMLNKTLRWKNVGPISPIAFHKFTFFRVWSGWRGWCPSLPKLDTEQKLKF